jgi:hypothetical protein
LSFNRLSLDFFLNPGFSFLTLSGFREGFTVIPQLGKGKRTCTAIFTKTIFQRWVVCSFRRGVRRGVAGNQVFLNNFIKN